MRYFQNTDGFTLWRQNDIADSQIPIARLCNQSFPHLQGAFLGIQLRQHTLVVESV